MARRIVDGVPHLLELNIFIPNFLRLEVFMTNFMKFEVFMPNLVKLVADVMEIHSRV